MNKQMQIIIGKNAGFCYGVNNAVTKTIETLLGEDKNCNEEVYCLGELVHNKQVVEKLERRGLTVIETVEELEKVRKGNDQKQKVIIRAHGVSPMIYQRLKELKCEIIDLTCPNVLVTHKMVEEFSNQEFYIFLIGKKTHPEVIGTYGFCKSASIIETIEEVEEAISNYKNSGKKALFILAQTTFSMIKFDEIVQLIQEKFENDEKIDESKNNLVIKNTICNATQIRQEETEKISKQVDYMIIVGGKNSSNTRKLYDIAKKNCEDSICVETAEELPIEEIRDKKEEKLKSLNATERTFKIGIMAGASTPKESIEDVKTVLERNVS